MTIHLRRDQEQRVQVVLSCGACEQFDEVVETALASVRGAATSDQHRPSG